MPLSEHDRCLIFFADYGNLQEVRDLLQAGANVNAQDDNDGVTALFIASQFGHVEVVRELLGEYNLDVNLRCIDGATALYIASQEGHAEVVRELLQHKQVDVNLQFTNGFTALDIALQNKHDDVVLLLIEHTSRLEKEDQSSGRPTGSGDEHQVTIDPPRPNENSPLSDDTMIEQDRSKLLHVMNTSSADPVELSLEYIMQCLTNHLLGTGTFGDVFLAEDSHLPKKFAVKMISPTHCNEAAIKEIRKTFQNELLVSSLWSESVIHRER
ncbi:hypothetical protein MHU86_13137 [Fragilaria crotonensis]|nr:hypothetical protein MHU86_13137 [Fragilaria crotonensis]